MGPQHSAKLMPIARSIMALPNVEMASHTYTHPFDWQKFAEGGKEGRANHLDIKGFHFGPRLMEREITGSLDFINKELAPPGKACKVLLWSGACNPDARTVALTEAAGVANMNGGETVITSASDSWTGIAPIGINKGGHLQIYAPNQNENIYTNEWRGPFYGFENVIETFERTDHPIRFKPVDIYYHSYSGSKQASLQALKKVYAWAMGREFYNLFVSEYVPKARDFYGIALAASDGGWEVSGNGDLREMRIPASLGYPDLPCCRGVIGYADAGSERYIHLSGGDAHIAVTQHPPSVPFLWNANGTVSHWAAMGKGFSFDLAGHLDLAFSLAGANGCRVTGDGKPLKGQATNEGRTTFKLKTRASHVEATCQ